MTTTETTEARPPRAKRIAEGAALRDEGTAQVENGADPRVILTIDAVIQKAIDSGERFSANDIRDELPVAHENLVGARVLSFVGRRVDGHPVMKKVSTTPSSLPSTHHHDIGVWLGWDAYKAEQVVEVQVASTGPRRPASAGPVHPDEQDMLALLEESPC